MKRLLTLALLLLAAGGGSAFAGDLFAGKFFSPDLSPAGKPNAIYTFTPVPGGYTVYDGTKAIVVRMLYGYEKAHLVNPPPAFFTGVTDVTGHGFTLVCCSGVNAQTIRVGITRPGYYLLYGSTFLKLIRL